MEPTNSTKKSEKSAVRTDQNDLELPDWSGMDDSPRISVEAAFRLSEEYRASLNPKMTYAEAIQFLYGLRTFGTKMGLANTLKLAALAGDPQKKLRFIHVAGTNGKGSTCAMLESVYRQAGLRVGLFTSPHLVAFGERIQVNRQPISENDVSRLVVHLQEMLRTFSAEEHPTFFEVVTVMALCYFAEQKCDVVIWETGLGGRLDATNIVTPLVSVITNIAFDHEQWLGRTLASIAFEKAGIIKPGIPVVSAATDPTAQQVIAETARSNKARMIQVSNESPVPNVSLTLLGRHQKLNAAVAVAAIHAANPVIPISDKAIQQGLSTVRWPGRLQIIERPDGQRILLDGAHNIAGAEALKQALDDYFPNACPALVLGILGDKNWQAICEMLAPRAERIFLAPVSSDRAASPHDLEKACRQANPTAPVILTESVAQALELASQSKLVLVTGSLYLVGEALELLASPGAPKGERGLNEWLATKDTTHSPISPQR